MVLCSVPWPVGQLVGTLLSSLASRPVGWYFAQFLGQLVGQFLGCVASLVMSRPVPQLLDQLVDKLSRFLGHWPVNRYQLSRCVCLLHRSLVAAFRHRDVTVPSYDIQMCLIDQRSFSYRGFLKSDAAATGCHRNLFTSTHRQRTMRHFRLSQRYCWRPCLFRYVMLCGSGVSAEYCA